MSNPLHIIVDTVPTDDVSFIVNLISGIVVPFLLLLITWFLTNASKNQAIKHSEDLRLSDRKHLFSDNVHQSLDNLFKSIQTLRHINLLRKKHKDWSNETIVNDEKIQSSGNAEAINMQHEVTRWHLDKLLDLETQHGTALVNVISAQTRVQHLLSEKHTSSIDSVINEICSASKVAGNVTEKMSNEFTAELNSLIKDIEADPEQWLKP